MHRLKGIPCQECRKYNSTTHMADMLLQEQNREVTDLYQKMRHSKPDSKALELAKELAVFEEKNMERLKKYL